MGIVFGDGGINNDWQLVITLNSIQDRDYISYVKALIEKLFHIEVAVRKRTNMNATVLVASSTSLVDYLVDKGAVRGNKVLQQIDIPKWILSNTEFQKSFVRGLVDTDGCLYIHRHKVGNKMYKNIGFCFTNGSQRLIKSVASLLREFEIKPYIQGNNTRIYLYSSKAVLNYLSIFGSSNPRISQKYIKWTGA